MRFLRNPARTVILWTVLCAIPAYFVVNWAIERQFWPAWEAWIVYGLGPIVVVWMLVALLIIWLYRHR